MSNSNVTTTFLAIAEAAATNIPQNPTPISTHTMDINSSDQQLQDFEDFLILAAADHEETKESTASSCLKASTTFSQNPFISSHDQNEMMTSSSVNDSCWEQVPRSSSADYNMELNDDKKTMERDDDVGFKIAFRTKSDIEIMDDGYKWRKYGKKMVKNSPNPRSEAQMDDLTNPFKNYYRCSNGGCKVKKRVERERDDPRFVITTYQGKHNHESLAPAPGHCTSHYALQILHQP